MKKLFDDYLFTESLPLEARLINMIYCAGIISALAVVIARIFMGSSPFLIITIFAIIFAVAAMLYFSNKFDAYKASTWIIVIVLCDILFPLAFFALGGVRSSIAAYFVLSIVIIFFLVNNKAFLPMLIVHIAIACFCYWLGAQYPEFVASLTEKQSYPDQIQTFIIVGICIGMIIRFQRFLFMAEKRKLDSTLLKLESETDARILQDNLLKSINRMASILISSDAEDWKSALDQSVEILYPVIDVDRLYVWKNEFINGELHYRAIYIWTKDDKLKPDMPLLYPLRERDGWQRDIAAGKVVNGPVSAFSESDRAMLEPHKMKSVLMLPIFLAGRFWGFVSFDDCRDERYFSIEAQDILRSGGHMMANTIERSYFLKQLAEAKDDAVQNARAKSEFLANMSHEIRTPLNAVIGMTTIGRAAAEVKKKNYSFDKIEEASTHLLGIINDILDMSKIDAGKLDLVMEELNLRKLLTKVVTVINFRIKEKQQHFSLDVDPALPHIIKSDDQRLSQVLLNLLGNAIKFTPEDGEIKLTVKQIRADSERCLIDFEVSDTGIGISEEQQQKLFLPFVQAESTTSRKFGGTGLGLAISKQITEMMGGGIGVTSVPGKGSAFHFTIDVAIGNEQSFLEKNSQKTDALTVVHDYSAYRILIAEDVDINREIITGLLEDTGLGIDFAENGRVAVEKFCADPDGYHLIFMDVQMPLMDGYAATEKIRAFAHEKAVRIPIIAMTANVFKEDIDRCKAVGMNDHLGKPIELARVFEVLEQYLVE
ncbi:hypothetical protein AGMMS49983_20320 [Clostridia bacterium]|nr:hypothetical protein AGMMS49983_20320 [Clostridia bacterium]